MQTFTKIGGSAVLVHEPENAYLRTVQKECDGPTVLQQGHWMTDKKTNTKKLVWEDVRHVPWHLYEEE